MPWDLKRNYPLLSEYPEFDGLKPREMKFIWLYANVMSPYVEAGYSDEKRALYAAQDSFWVAEGKLLNTIPVEKFEKLSTGVFSDEIKGAIEAMARFDPRLRYEAQLAVDNMIALVYASINYTPDEMKAKDPDDQKKILDMIKIANQVLPELMKQKEKGYAFVIKSKSGNKSTKSFEGRLDAVLQRRTSN